MNKYRLLITYDGTNYAGWQRQTAARSVQACIEAVLSKITQTPIRIIGSGRTDAGVHARGQVAHFSSEKALDPYRVKAALNGLLDKDIRILEVTETYADFHSQYTAKEKTYQYHLLRTSTRDPFSRLYSWHIAEELDLDAMRVAARHLTGTHDFTTFANSPTEGSVAKNAVRTILDINFHEDDEHLRISFRANGFLYKMVRNLTGCLVDVGLGKVSADSIPGLLLAQDRRKIGQGAPAHGLFLHEVVYKEEPTF